MKSGLLALFLFTTIAAGGVFLRATNSIDLAELTIILLFDIYFLIAFYSYKQEKYKKKMGY